MTTKPNASEPRDKWGDIIIVVIALAIFLAGVGTGVLADRVLR